MAEDVRARTYIPSRLKCNAVGQQTIGFFLDDRVAFARASLETILDWTPIYSDNQMSGCPMCDRVR